MPKKMEVAIGREMRSDHRIRSNSGPKLVSWAVQRWWENRGDASSLSQEFFTTLKIAQVSKEMFGFVDETSHVPAAETSHEKFMRRFVGQTEGAYDYSTHYLTITLTQGFAHRMVLHGLEIERVRELLQQPETTISAFSNDNGGELSISTPEALKHSWAFTIYNMEVVRSPLAKKFKRRKEYAAD